MDATCKIVLTPFLYEPMQTVFQSIEMAADMLLMQKAITVAPTVTKRPASRPDLCPGMWVLELEVPVAEQGVWLGFCQGIHFARGNREIVVTG